MAAGVKGCSLGEHNHVRLWLDGDTVPVKTHIAFAASSKEQVDGFYNEALKAGGQDNGEPGTRDNYGPHYYAAFVLDPDGHNIEVVYRG